MSRPSQPRRTIEDASRYLDIGDLLRLEAFDQHHPDRKKSLRTLKLSFLDRLVVSCFYVELHHHNGTTQKILVRWVGTGFGNVWQRRPFLVCPRCFKRREKLYPEPAGLFLCRKCLNIPY